MKTLHNNYNYIIMNKQQISKVSKVSKYSMFFHSISNPLHEQAFAGCVERIYRVLFKCADYARPDANF